VNSRRLHLVAAYAVVLLWVAERPLRPQDSAAPLFRYDGTLTPRWSTPEGRDAGKGRAGSENDGAKGHPCEPIKAGATCVLLDAKGPGMISRIWLTVDDRSPEMLRSLKLEFYWDNEAKPAVSVPLGDFFGVGLGRTARFHNALFADPEGRSFICYVPMPYRKSAKIQITNESGKDLTRIFFEVDLQLLRQWDSNNLYFHAYWSRSRATALGRDFELLPKVLGRGRFIGANVGVNANPAYQNLWWGEGEVKMYLDGDAHGPTFAGTGTEDYVGTGWGEAEFFNDFSGCLVADQKKAQWAFYRFHLPDPIFFQTDCRVTLQQLGGGPVARVTALRQANVPLIPAGVDVNGTIVKLYEKHEQARNAGPPSADGWENFFRSDDVSATAYFYLDTPSSDLPRLQPVSDRIDGTK
jgi:hypothetical protein